MPSTYAIWCTAWLHCRSQSNRWSVYSGQTPPIRPVHSLPQMAHFALLEIKDVSLPEGMKRSMSRQAEAERERRAKVIAAQGELQASETLAQAARNLAVEPSAIQLRYLQTVTEIAAENNSTTIFPIPIDLFEPFLRRSKTPEGGGTKS